MKKLDIKGISPKFIVRGDGLIDSDLVRLQKTLTYMFRINYIIPEEGDNLEVGAMVFHVKRIVWGIKDPGTIQEITVELE
jgi:hypothetical protein